MIILFLIFFQHMIPYKPNKIQNPSGVKLKPIPSPELVLVLTSLTEQTDNTYDRKNHILTIRDYNLYADKLQEKLGRSTLSFEKQLKMLGFRKKNIYADMGSEKGGKVIFTWKGKKELLINHELNFLERTLAERKEKIKQTRDQIQTQKKFIDSKIQSIIMSMMVNPSSQSALKNLSIAINDTRSVVNSVEYEAREVISEISLTLANELELYKLLISKEDNMCKKELKLKEDEEEQENEKNQSQENKEGNEYEMNGSEVSIQISQGKSEEDK